MPGSDPQWYKDAIIYELPVRAFHDGIGDGMGDLRGLTQKLDYLHDLGITAIWLLPFYPSPARDDGYDIADYTSIHPHFGQLDDFREFLAAAHERGLRVVTELVLNHTSDQHPWFQRARRAPADSPERNFYVWSDSPDRYRDVRIIFKDFETSNWTWDPLAKAYFWHRFYSHQPDLNYDNPQVWQAILPVVDFWFGLGVDGLRLDAVPYLYEREGTNCENLPETHAFLRELRAHVDAKYPDRMLLAEANQWPEQAVAYFGSGDECHMAFHFPVMPRLFMSIHREDRFPIVDIMDQTPSIPGNCQWAMFLRNHDELTLEMVTDEERDYMYRAYANDPQARINLGIRRRLAPLLGNNRRRIELMNGLLFSLPGTPVLYYGDEIGMGDNIYLGDRNGVRTPMQWSADRNAGFSRANPQKLYLPIIIDPEYHYEAINVDSQQNNPNSLLWWMKRLIGLRKRFPAFGRGTLEFLHPENRKILAFLRTYEDDSILVVANLSRFVQYAEIDLSRFHGVVPVELFGSTPFPRIGYLPYLLTLSPHSFYWFSLSPRRARQVCGDADGNRNGLPVVRVSGPWEGLLEKVAIRELEELLTKYVVRRLHPSVRPRAGKTIRIYDQIPIVLPTSKAYFLLIRGEFADSGPDSYTLPLAFAEGDQARDLLEGARHAVVAQLVGSVDGVLFDAWHDANFCNELLHAAAQNELGPRGREGGGISAWTTAGLAESVGELKKPIATWLGKTEQSHSSVVFGSRIILKAFRRLSEGVNPELEIGRHFADRARFANAAPLLGAIEYERRNRPPLTLAVLHEFIVNEGDAWQYTLDELGNYFERVLATCDLGSPPPFCGLPLDLVGQPLPEPVGELLGGYLESARLLGRRTAEMHLALATDQEHPEFTPEPFTELYQRSVYQSMRSEKLDVFHRLAAGMRELPEAYLSSAEKVLATDDQILNRYRPLVEQRFRAARIRCHGDYHLGQVLYTGKDFVVIDFEGPAHLASSERRIKRSPLRDLVGMVRSFHRAAHSVLLGCGSGRGQPSGTVRHEDQVKLEPWAEFWHAWTCSAFLRSYLHLMESTHLLPHAHEHLSQLFDIFLLEKTIAELGRDLTYQPEWSIIPLLAILGLISPQRQIQDLT